MTMKEVMERYVPPRECRIHPALTTAQLRWKFSESYRRYEDLEWVLVARRINIRTAHNRWLRRHGQPLARRVR